MKNKTLNIILRIIPAFIMLQTLWFKFSASEESVFIFSTLGVEPWGRIAAGVFELIAGILLLISSTSVYGALIGAVVMAGAIASHIFILGFEIIDDGGQLFIYALVIFGCCSLIIYLNRNKLMRLI